MWKPKSRSLPANERFSKFSDTMPPIGNRPIFTAITNKPSARARSGMTSSAAVPHETKRSDKRPKRSALQIPSGKAIPQASSIAVTVKSRVFRARTNKSGATGVL